MTWTNPTIRKLLGERGFIMRQGQTPLRDATGYLMTYWDRGDITVTLWEHDEKPPELWDQSRHRMDPLDLGYRNPNVQEGGHAP
jgi:hypothetical protein